MKKNKQFGYILLLLVLILFVFRQYFNFNNDLVWGDAPHYYNFKDLLGEPSAWVYRDNNLGGINRFLWISPLMLLYGFIGQFVNSNAALIRLFFYFPSLLLASAGAYFLSRTNGFKPKYATLSSLIFTINPYYLLLIDGGTVGLALAYGIFPWAIISLRHFLSSPNHKSFLLTIIVNFLLTLVDPRIFILAIMFSLLFPQKSMLLRYKLIHTGLISVIILLLSGYWFYPLFKSSSNFFAISTDGGLTYDLIYPLMLTHPYWPTNIFGQTNLPNILFIYFPTILTLPFIFRTKDIKRYGKLLLIFLLFAFFAKGGGRPFGNLYNLFIFKFPLAQAFRDASKFYTPLLLTYSLLLAFVINKFKKLFYSSLLVILLISYPVIKGIPNGILSGNKNVQDIEAISQKVENSNGRVFWFPSVHPYSVNDQNTQSISASSLVDYRPFARLNAGTYDRFNFLHNSESAAWLAYINTKYLALINDPRHPIKDKKESQHWQSLLDLISSQSYLEKVFDQNNSLLYKFTNETSYLNAYDKAYFVIGPDSIYQELIKDDYKISDNLLIFTNQSGFDSSLFTNIEDKNAIELIFYHTNLEDLVLRLIPQEELLSGSDAEKVEWAVRSRDQYLSYKYEILTKGITFNGFDLEKGIAFSTKPNEVVEFNKNILTQGDYKLAVRGMFDASGSAQLKVLDSQNKTTNYELKPNTNLGWQVFDVFLTTGNTQIDIINNQGVQIFNTLSLVHKDEYNQTLGLAQTLTDQHKTSYIKQDEKLPLDIFESQNLSLSKTSAIPSKFELNSLSGYSWITFSDSYDPGWHIKKDNYSYHSVPANTMGNAVYKRIEWDRVDVNFQGQRDFRWGIYFSVITFLIISIIYLITLERKHK